MLQCDKLECLRWQAFQLRQFLLCRPGAYPSGAPYYALNVAGKDLTRNKMFEKSNALAYYAKA
jgi:hypothetical protein